MKLYEYTSTRNSWGGVNTPKSVQKSIPIDRIYEDGMWRSGNVYSQMWSVSDINYAMVSDSKKEEIQLIYGKLYAGVPSDCTVKMCIVSQRMDDLVFRRDVLYRRANDGHDDLRAEKNRQLTACASLVGNVIQHKYVIISTQKPRVDDARDRLRQVQGHLINILSELGSTVRSVDNSERLRILHNFFRVGEESRFEFDLDRCTRLGEDFRDFVAPDTIEFKRDHIVIDNRVAKCMSMSYFPQRIDDKLISTLLQQVPYIILTMDFVPIETEDAYKTLADYRMKVDADKVRFNRKSVDNLDFTANVPQRTQEEEGILNQWQNDMSNHDQQMFLTLLTAAFFADDLEELRQETDALKTAAGNFNCRFTEMRWQQENAFNTAMPYGLRRIANLRAMTTKGVASLIPFNTQEVLVPGGIYYGVNAISGNLIIGLRTVLINGNAMVIATSGGGKSLFVKQELLELFLRFLKAKFYIVDPENEYGPLVRELGGIVVDISVDSTTYFNPLDFTYDPSTKIQPHTAKAEFVLSLCEQIMGKDNIQAGDKSLIDRSLKHIYKPLIQSGYKAACPTLTDLYNDLKAQPHERAHEIALALELFATGSMNMFAQPTNVDMSNRLICFNIQSLGDQLKPVAMLSMLEYINTCVMSNERNDPKAATWVYFDEIYLLLRDKLSSQFLYTSWKRFRKYNAFATGITQNVQDCLANDTAYAMLANSEFVCMLRQTKDIDSVVELYGLSDPQKNYLKLAKPGQGILKLGNNLIPFVNDHPTNTKIYRLITTKPGEMEN
ncbi:MAG TPA: ATP-binding protein [Subdoligranulum variabile]|uniref:ATP-binding protein n=1 Tax=Subdoligranulum variabile TaxID=214851 RepID=A0A921IKS7_9FIRM|nr:ATP-binding protein [Subdoligranulum variabile]